MKLLLVEDEEALRTTVVDVLRQNGYVVEVAVNFTQAYEKIKCSRYDCVLVDLTLPDGDGLDLVRALQADSSPAGVLVLTARTSLNDRVEGLDLGADDYLVKPFHLSELNTRVRAIIRRQLQGQYHLVFRDLLVWPEQNEVVVHGSP